jgi:ribosomal protein S11
MAQTTKNQSLQKKIKKSFTNGVVHQSTFNNTIVTITNLTGDTSGLQLEVQALKESQKYTVCSLTNKGQKKLC